MQRHTIRNAIPKDAERIAYTHVKTWQFAYRGLIPDQLLDALSIEDRTIGWKERIENSSDDMHTLVVEADSLVVGWCTVGPTRDKDTSNEVGELYGIYIAPEFIGKGLGKDLMVDSLQRLKDDGFKKATLWVLGTNEKARRFYEREGWKIEGGKKEDNRNGTILNEVRYIKEL